MYVLYVITVLALLFSFFANKKKTKKAVKIGMKKLWKITPPFTMVLIVVAFLLYLIPQNVISSALGGDYSVIKIFVAALIGTVTVMPGPIAYPLCGILIDNGVAYSVIAAFSISLMMIGVATFPIEKSFYGWKFAFLRNGVSFFIAIVVALLFVVFQGFIF